jgi:CheY-like chemotaxis protein
MAPSILLIDDNADNLDLIAYLLRASGHAPRLAGGGAEGVRLAIEEPPDLILVDIRMPGMDGYEVVAVLRREPRLAATRIVAVTASVMVDDRKRMVDAGFDGYIQKPIDAGSFVEGLDPYLGPAQSEGTNRGFAARR